MGIAAEGDSLSTLFQQAALGARQIMTACSDIGSDESFVVEVQGQDLEELLVDWLSELLFLCESRQFLPASFEIEITPELQLRARVWGESLDRSRCELQREIKAVTYHQIKVEKRGDGWQAQVFVDL